MQTVEKCFVHKLNFHLFPPALGNYFFHNISAMKIFCIAFNS